MKFFFTIIFCSLFSFILKASDSLNVLSPDKSIHVIINTNKTLTYSITIDNKKIVTSSVIDIQLKDGKKLSDDLSIRSTKHNSVNQFIEQIVPYQQKNIPDVYNELVIQFKKSFGVI